MGGEKPVVSLEDAMKEIRERLRSVSENLNKVREGANGAEVTEAERPEPAGIVRGAITHQSLPFSRWPEHLTKLVYKLDAITGDTESEFLSIGARLHDYYHRAQKISELSEYVARLVTDKEIENTIAELNLILEKMNLWLSGSRAESGRESQCLKAKMIVEKTGVCLESLNKKHYKSAYMLLNFSTRSDDLARSIGRVVESLQYNDITRQRLENAKKAIDALAGSLRDSRRPEDTELPVYKDLAVEAGRICKAQASVLLVAKDELNAAANSVVDNLRLVAENSLEISQEIRAATRGDCESGKSFLSTMGNWLSALTVTLTSLTEEAGASAEMAVSVNAGGCEKPRLEYGSMLEELCIIVNSLRKINGNILYHLSLIDEAGKGLSEDIGNTVDKIGIHVKVSRVTEAVVADLECIVEESRRIAPEASLSGNARNAGAHAAFGGCNNERPSPADVELSGGLSGGKVCKPHDADELGENVELF